MPKKVGLEILLLEEADNISNSEIETDILEFFREHMPKMPWFKEVSQIEIT